MTDVPCRHAVFPLAFDRPVGKLDEVESVVDIWFQTVGRDMRAHVVVLILARQSYAEDRERFSSDFLCKPEIFEKSESVALVIVWEEAVAEGVVPSVFVERTVFDRPDTVFHW